MPALEKASTKLLGILHLASIRSKIIVFALLATLIPSLTMGWLSYVHNRRFLAEKITTELQNVTTHTSRELGLWLKERQYEIRVFSSSYVVSENLEKLSHARLSPIERTMAHRRITDYLKSVREKFVDYEEFMAIDARGKVVATSFEGETALTLPQGWLQMAETHKSVIGSPFFDQTHKTGVMVVAEPIVAAQDRFLGVLAAKLNFRGIGKILRNYALDQTDELYLMTQEGTLLVSSQPITSGFMQTNLRKSTSALLYAREAVPLDYKSHKGDEVVGTLKKVPQLDWGVVAEKDRAKAYAEISELHNLTVALVAGLLLIIGLTAYLLGLIIVRPLNRLTSGADRVAAGDLDFDLPVLSGGELGYLTQVFNHMVRRLRQGREELAAINEALREKNRELHEISITDSLTTLYNRKHLAETLATEVARSKRNKHHFALLMIDIDHFKQYNDTYGHLAGDDVLRKMAAIFKDSIRSCDYAARYGGEEFLVMLPETGEDGAMHAAERIRTQVEREVFAEGDHAVSITVSIGVSTFPRNGEDPKSLISSADDALYEAKEKGRNRVILFGEEPRKRP